MLDFVLNDLELK